MSPGLRRAVDLSLSGGENVLHERHLQVFARYGSFLDHLPLERLTAVRTSARSIELQFDFGSKRTRTVELPLASQIALEAARGKDPLEHGKVVRSKPKARKLVVHREVRFEIEGDGEISALRGGDLEVDVGLFDFDLDVRTFTDSGRIARDDDGRILVALDGDGNPLRREGRWVPQRYDHWVEIRAAGRRCEIGVSVPDATVPPDARLAGDPTSPRSAQMGR